MLHFDFKLDDVHQGMYNPRKWPLLARYLNDTTTNLDEALSTPLELVDNDSSSTPDSLTPPGSPPITVYDALLAKRPAPDYSFQGITCGDAVDVANVTTKDVFDSLVGITRNISPMCTPPLLIHSLRYLH